ncbi:MAG: hypothetical protein AAFY56_21475, partial [Pseudomonadota bacterium]
VQPIMQPDIVYEDILDIDEQPEDEVEAELARHANRDGDEGPGGEHTMTYRTTDRFPPYLQ